ncbi:holin [Glutamicibacter ardleyensis]
MLTAGGVGILDSDLLGAASVGGQAALVSVLTSIAPLP